LTARPNRQATPPERATIGAFYFETRRASGAWVHRSYLAKE
jgi:hypothetical protein